MRKTARQVLLDTCYRLYVDPSDILSTSRKQPLCQKRQEVMFELFTQCPHVSYPGIGRILKRDHTTVVHGVRAHCERLGISYQQAIIMRIGAHKDMRKISPAWMLTYGRQEVFSAMMAEYGQAMRTGMGRAA